MERARLAVVVDGVPMPDDEARALWERFSAWMEEHRGDLAGFAREAGFASIHPGVDGGRPVLLASHTEQQQAYGPAKVPPPPNGGSAGPRDSATGDRPRKKKRRN